MVRRAVREMRSMSDIFGAVSERGRALITERDAGMGGKVRELGD